mmetsp:Transcript_73222/g.211929  ORF Transcript_73222/g.211929 Transcript_73222/m.211929 type:complete len:366 (-) Transcript_73222:1582-2679(-)
MKHNNRALSRTGPNAARKSSGNGFPLRAPMLSKEGLSSSSLKSSWCSQPHSISMRRRSSRSSTSSLRLSWIFCPALVVIDSESRPMPCGFFATQARSEAWASQLTPGRQRNGWQSGGGGGGGSSRSKQASAAASSRASSLPAYCSTRPAERCLSCSAALRAAADASLSFRSACSFSRFRPQSAASMLQPRSVGRAARRSLAAPAMAVQPVKSTCASEAEPSDIASTTDLAPCPVTAEPPSSRRWTPPSTAASRICGRSSSVTMTFTKGGPKSEKSATPAGQPPARAIAKRRRKAACCKGVRPPTVDEDASASARSAPYVPASPCVPNFSISSSARPSSFIMRRSTKLSFGSSSSKISRRASTSTP